MTVLFLLYGPISAFREWLVTTAMTTMTHQYFATWFYDDETIEHILENIKAEIAIKVFFLYTILLIILLLIEVP
jgi:exopolysaccharide biosynthesis protein